MTRKKSPLLSPQRRQRFNPSRANPATTTSPSFATSSIPSSLTSRTMRMARTTSLASSSPPPYTATWGTQFPPPQRPPAYPIIDDAATSVVRARREAEHAILVRDFASYEAAERATAKFIRDAVDELWYRDLRHDRSFYTHVTAKQLLAHLDDNCGGLHPSELSLPQTTSLDQPMIGKQNPANKTWTGWKTHYRAAHIARKRQLLASGTAMPPSTANALIAEDNVHLTEGTFARLDGYLDNLAAAATTERTTLQSLTEANAALVANLTALTTSVASLTAAYTSLAAVQHASVPPGLATQQPRRTRANTRPSTTLPTTPGGYCWTHGFRVREGHSSATCANKAEGHKDTATRANTMGGSMVNKGWESK
eukprot:CCRYP_020543-RA/>CCRYP_020543-RA protein AED:0.35 eAED:0.91 QI:0/0/0/1/1/1/2/0/366